MTVHLNIAEAKAKLSELVARAERGEEVVLTRRGKPAVRIVAEPRDGLASQKPWMKSLGAWAHLGPLTEEENELLLAPDPAWERQGAAEPPP